MLVESPLILGYDATTSLKLRVDQFVSKLNVIDQIICYYSTVL